METVTLSKRYGVVLPRSVRKQLKIRPGEKLQVVVYGDRIELIPLRPIQEARGFMRGIDTEVEREEEDRV